MFRFLRDFDRISFWLGFLAATLFWWLITYLRPWLRRLLTDLQQRSQLSKLGAAAVTEIRLRNDLLRHTQKLHLTAPFFSLDEILIQPRVLTPPARTEPGVVPPPLDITEQILPYALDWPEVASYYGAPSMTLLDALQGDANLLVIGAPGSGKTVALAELAAQFSRSESTSPQLKALVPLFMHAMNLVLPPANPAAPLNPLVNAVAFISPSVPAARLESFLGAVFSMGRALIILDGLDELPPNEIDKVSVYLSELIQQYPQTRLVAAAAPEYLDGLAALNFVPMALAGWDESQRQAFIAHWSELWAQHIAPRLERAESTDPALLNAWLHNETALLSPLELTLKVWGTYTGDLTGSRISNWCDTYIHRMTANISKGKPALEALASQALQAQKPVFTPREAQSWLVDIEPLPPVEAAPADSTEIPSKVADPLSPPKSTASTAAPIRDSRVLPRLIDEGLLLNRIDGRVSFAHPFLFCYLAACGLEAIGGASTIAYDGYWGIQSTALAFLAAQREDTWAQVRSYAEENQEPLFQDLLKTSHWLRYTPENAAWRAQAMRLLAKVMQKESYPMGLRTRAMAAMALSNTPGVDALFRQLLQSSDSNLRQLTALGCGLVRDTKAVDDLRAVLQDPRPNLRRAVCLALAGIANQPALDALAEELIHGDDDVRQYAAEALANHVDEGHPTLKEAAALADLRVRRAAVYGLRRVRQPWSTAILEDMQVREEQWVVKDAATTVLVELSQPEARRPKSLPVLSETPWLIAFAGERGIGIAPGKPALDLLLLALKEGKEEQRLAALETIARLHEPAALPVVLQTYQTSQGEVRESAFNTLWHLAASGLQIPEPVN